MNCEPRKMKIHLSTSLWLTVQYSMHIMKYLIWNLIYSLELRHCGPSSSHLSLLPPSFPPFPIFPSSSPHTHNTHAHTTQAHTNLSLHLKCIRIHLSISISISLSLPSHIIPHNTALYRTVPHVLHHIISYDNIPYYRTAHHTVRHSTVQHRTVTYSIIPYRTYLPITLTVIATVTSILNCFEFWFPS